MTAGEKTEKEDVLEKPRQSDEAVRACDCMQVVMTGKKIMMVD